MKRITSLIIAVSILFQIWIPITGSIIYAQTGEQAGQYYGLKWERDRSLNQGLKLNNIKAEKTEALVSWKMGRDPLAGGSYILEYFVENESGSNNPAEKVQLKFTPNLEYRTMAEVEIAVLNADNTSKEKTYQKFDFNNPNMDKWDVIPGNKISLDVTRGSTYPGGRVIVGTQLEIRFRWESDNTLYLQTNSIKNGNITPFSLSHSNLNPGKSDDIKVLSGLEGFTISPMHIEINGDQIEDTPIVEIPGGEQPGSKPGVKIEFKRPKDLKSDSKFDLIDDDQAEKIGASLKIADLTDTATAQLSFDLRENTEVTGLDNSGKKLRYNEGTYTLYLAKDDMGSKEIIKWDALQESLIFKQVDLSLATDEQALGIFMPEDRELTEDMGKYTYLGYTIKRSSIQDAYIEVQPYRGAYNTEFTYTVDFSSDTKDTKNWTKLVEHKYMSIGDGEKDVPFTIPVPFSTTDTNQYYRITVKYSQGTIYSQILHYKPDEDLTIPPPTPIIQSVDNIYVVPPKGTSKQPETIGFDLTWSAPSNAAPGTVLDKLLENGKIYYELYLHDDKEADSEKQTLLKVFEVSTDESGNIAVNPYGGTAGKFESVIRYNSANNAFTMENVVLKNSGQDKWEQIIDMPGITGETIDYPDLTDKVDNRLDKTVPNIYYLTMRALYDPKASDVAVGISNMSNPQSISLSVLEEIIPVPTRIESNHLPDENSPHKIIQSISWGNIDTSRYKKQMLDPLNLSIGEDGERTYEIYLYQNKSIKESTLSMTTPASFYLNDSQTLCELTNQDVETLRKGEVVRMDYKSFSTSGMSNITIEGLDSNQVYYVTIRVRLDVQDGGVVKPRHSIFSKQHSFTTYTRPSDPEPGERVPPVPEELRIISQPNNTTATIGWKAPNYNKQDDENLYYEIIRIDSRTLAKEENSRLLSVEQLIDKDTKNELEAWYTKEPFVFRYQKSKNLWEEAEPRQSSNRLQIEDASLSPNKIYYYYVRTVLVIEGEEVYSSWVGIPVTTDPIQKPIMLKVENTDMYSHDPKREIVVSFLAPIPEDGKIPSEYDFDIAVQGELDEDYRLDYSIIRLTSKEESENIPTGYTHFVYKISGAKPGKRYDIKVRVIDKLKGMEHGEYPKSLYSDRVTTRTHFDQDEQDKDDKFAQYIKYFEDKAEALRRRPYWSIDQGKNTFAIKYRGNYIIPAMKGGKTYPLESKEGILDYSYYMPASVMTSSNLDQIGFEINQGSVSYTVRPSMITTELEELQVILQDIGEKRIRDYYVVFNFNQVSQGISTTGDGYLTPKIAVDIDLVRLKEEDIIIEDDIMIALNSRIEREKTTFINELERALDRGRILNEDLDRIVNASIASIEEKHQSDVKSILKSNSNKTVPIESWNKSILIVAKVDGSAIAEGYFLGRTDILLPTFNVLGGYGVEANQPGVYVFKGQRVVMPTIPGVGGATNIVVQYQLTDFFGINGVINPNSVVTKRGILGSMARVLGAPRGSDYNQYLRQLNIKGVTNLGMDSPIKKGEAIYLLMQVYEKNMKKSLESVYVKNRNAVSNIRQFNPLHQPYVLVAVDSKIISAGIGPNDTVYVKDVLQILTNILTGQR